MSDLLALFAKAPVAGRVKTRLVPPLTAEQAAAVHEASLHDVLMKARSTEFRIVLFYDPSPGAGDYFRRVLPDTELHPQAEGDLGTRMADTFEWAFGQGHDRAFILGTDSPTLPVAYLDSACEQLDQSDAVVGPAADGGYYLVGIRSHAWPRARALFEKIRWSTGSVLDETVTAARSAGVQLTLAPAWYDIDRGEDLARAAVDAESGSRLAKLLQSFRPW